MDRVRIRPSPPRRSVPGGEGSKSFALLWSILDPCAAEEESGPVSSPVHPSCVVRTRWHRVMDLCGRCCTSTSSDATWIMEQSRSTRDLAPVGPFHSALVFKGEVLGWTGRRTDGHAAISVCAIVLTEMDLKSSSWPSKTQKRRRIRHLKNASHSPLEPTDRHKKGVLMKNKHTSVWNVQQFFDGQSCSASHAFVVLHF